MQTPRRASIAILLVAVCGVAATPAVSSSAKTLNASIRERGVNFFFAPHRLTIRRGDRVRWRWCPNTQGCSAEHNVVGFLKGRTAFKHPRNASVTRGIMAGAYTHTFTKAGNYELVCTIHGFSMTVKVR
jgi:plastocyanin